VNEKTRVALADDHPIILSGLGNLIEAESDLELVGQAASGQSALKMIREKLPDVAIVDISMPEINGIVLARRLAEEREHDSHQYQDDVHGVAAPHGRGGELQRAGPFHGNDRLRMDVDP